MKWTAVSLLGAAWAVIALVLSLVFGSALPVSNLAMGLTAIPAGVIAIVAWRGDGNDGTYRKLHRFSPAAKRLALLCVALWVLGMVAFINGASYGSPDTPLHLRSHSHVWAVTEAEYHAAEAAQFRIIAGWVLAAYATIGLMTVFRAHYRPVVPR